MEKLIVFILTCMVCNSHASQRKIYELERFYPSGTNLMFSFYDDRLFYTECQTLRNERNCTFGRTTSIFDSSYQKQFCHVNKISGRKWMNHFEPLGIDHATLLVNDNEMLVVRFSDCRYITGRLSDDPSVRNKALTDIGVDIQGLYSGALQIFIAYPSDMSFYPIKNYVSNGNSFGRLGSKLNPTWKETTLGEFASLRSGSHFSLHLKGTDNQLNKLGEYQSPAVTIASGANDCVTIVESSTDSYLFNVAQYDWNGASKVRVQNFRNERYLALHNSPGGGFYLLSSLLTKPNEKLNDPNKKSTMRLIKMNPNGQLAFTHTFEDYPPDFDNYIYNNHQIKVNFYATEDGKICVSWVDLKNIFDDNRKFEIILKCFDEFNKNKNDDAESISESIDPQVLTAITQYLQNRQKAEPSNYGGETFSIGGSTYELNPQGSQQNNVQNGRPTMIFQGGMIRDRIKIQTPTQQNPQFFNRINAQQNPMTIYQGGINGGSIKIQSPNPQVPQYSRNPNPIIYQTATNGERIKIVGSSSQSPQLVNYGNNPKNPIIIQGRFNNQGGDRIEIQFSN